MDRVARAPLLARLALAVLVGVLAGGSTLTAPARAATATAAHDLSAWDGGINLYRPGVFATQRTWQWCTAAGVQIVRNIVHGESDEARARQNRYYRYMRDHNRYPVRAQDGVDPGGWAAGLRRFVDERYGVVGSDSFGAALRSAVTSLRRTNLPVGLTVARGSHAWILTGFTATADPLVTDDFRVTSVRVAGPLWGLQSRARGYDMRPNTKLTPAQLEGYFTPWHYARIRMAWEGQWVSIQPVGRASATPALATAAAVARPPTGPPTPRRLPSRLWPS
jgi:hypothetical protein